MTEACRGAAMPVQPSLEDAGTAFEAARKDRTKKMPPEGGFVEEAEWVSEGADVRAPREGPGFRRAS